MKQYCYVIVEADGESFVVGATDPDSLKACPNYFLEMERALDFLLKRGWSPLRETPMGGGHEKMKSLVVLEKAGE